MTERETGQTKELADIIIKKFRALIALENRVLETREEIRQIPTICDNTVLADLQENLIVERQEMLSELELQLKENVEEMERIIDELKLETPHFRTYVLPQMSEIVGTLKICGAAEVEELTQLVDALMDEENTESLAQLEAVIITRLRDNLEKTFGT